MAFISHWFFQPNLSACNIPGQVPVPDLCSNDWNLTFLSIHLTPSPDKEHFHIRRIPHWKSLGRRQRPPFFIKEENPLSQIFLPERTAWCWGPTTQVTTCQTLLRTLWHREAGTMQDAPDKGVESGSHTTSSCQEPQWWPSSARGPRPARGAHCVSRDTVPQQGRNFLCGIWPGVDTVDPVPGSHIYIVLYV